MFLAGLTACADCILETRMAEELSCMAFRRAINKLYAILTHEWNGLLASASEAWEKIGIVAKAWAATASISVGNTSAIVGQPFSLTLTEKNLGCSGNDNWSITPSPPASWLTGPTLSGNKNSVATWTGTPPGTTGSPYTFSATVSRGACNVTISNKQITVSASTLVVDTMSLPTAQVGVIYPVTLLGHGGYGTKNWSIVSGSLPPGLTLSSAGVISGTPTSNSGSPYVFSLHFTDSATPVETSNAQQLSLTVNASSFAISTASPLPNGTASNFYSQPLSGTGGLPPYTNWTVASGNLPPGLTLNASTGVISGTLASSSPGTYTFTISLTDSLPTTVSKAFSLTITSVSAPLSISSSCPNPDAVKGNPYSYTMQATGGNGDYTWSATPSWLSIDPLSGMLSGTAPNSTGSSTFTITVSDNHDQASATCTLAVVSVSGIRSERYTIAVDRLEEACTDLNGNDICDSAESFNLANDLNGNSVWDGKVGIFQQFYDEIKPKARWGLTDFTKQLGVNIESGSACIPAKPASSFYTAIQNVSRNLLPMRPLQLPCTQT